MVQLYCPFLPPIEEWIGALKKYFGVTLVMRSVNAAEPEGQREGPASASAASTSTSSSTSTSPSASAIASAFDFALAFAFAFAFALAFAFAFGDQRRRIGRWFGGICITAAHGRGGDRGGS